MCAGMSGRVCVLMGLGVFECVWLCVCVGVFECIWVCLCVFQCVCRCGGVWGCV